MCVVLCKTRIGQNMYFFFSIIKDRKRWLVAFIFVKFKLRLNAQS